MIKAKRTRVTRICQGDILRNVEHVEYVSDMDGIIEVSKVIFPLVIVLTQDCDLEQDYRFRTTSTSSQDKWLMSVLVAPLYNAEHVYQGEHLSELNIKMAQVNKKATEGKYLRNNDRPRYHYLEFANQIAIVPSVIDFKHYFSVNVTYIKTTKRSNFVCTVSDLFREDISLRFANFLSRIGLPEVEQS